MKLSEHDIESLAKTALEAAQIAADFIQSESSKTHKIELKSGTQSLAAQVVTAIDLNSQALILAYLAPSIQEFDLGLLTEESPDDGSRHVKDYFWCIDPLDGTLPFTEQREGYAVSIALVSRTGQPVIGVVVDPYHQRTYQATKGQGCWIDGNPFAFKPQDANQLVCHFDQSFLQSAEYPRTLDHLDVLCKHMGFSDLKIRTGAGAVMNALELLDTAAGCYFKLPKTNPGGGSIWDFAATHLIYQELRLYSTNVRGNCLKLNDHESTYMNGQGVIYATEMVLGKELVDSCHHVLNDRK